MGLYCYHHVHQSDGVTFDDVAAMNAELDANGVSELLDPDNIAYWTKPQSTMTGFIAQDDSGTVMIGGVMDSEWSGHSHYASTYGIVGDGDYAIIARHMTAGKLVFRIELEGHPDEYVVMTPGEVTTPKLSF